MVDLFSAKRHYDNFLNRIFNASEGKLNDQRTRSVNAVLGRAFGEGLSDAEEVITTNVNNAIAQAVPRLFGLTTSEGTRASVVLVFTPARINTVQPFTIDQNFRVTLNGVLFETDAIMTVPPGALNGSVNATALLPGAAGNVAANALADWQVVPGLLKIHNPKAAFGGLEAKNIDNLSTDIVNTLINRALISADNYTFIAKQLLGVNSAAVTIPNLGLDGISYERGTMHVYANNNGNPLDATTKGALLTALSKGWATVYVSDIIVSLLNIRVYLKADRVENQQALANTLNNALRTLFNPLTYAPGTDIDVLDTVGFLYKIPGVRQVGSLQFGLNTEITEAKDYPLAVNTTVKVAKVTFNYVDPVAEYVFTTGTINANFPDIDDFGGDF